MPVTKFSVPEKYKYLEGFGGYHQSEAIPGANPIGANSPQLPPFFLSTERISGTSFTAPRASNLQTWLYRVHPSLSHSDFTPLPSSRSSSEEQFHLTPNALRWNDFPTTPNQDFLSSQKVIAQSGDPSKKEGLAYLTYSASNSMPPNTVFFSSDGDYLIIPQAGTLDIHTELGNLLVRQNEICVIPRGIKYRVTLPNGNARGYICELYQGHFQLPELGPIGSCSLANARDFQVPIATFEGRISNGVASCSPERWTILTKFAGSLWECTQEHTPFDIAAWHGTYYPYKYDLGRFSVLGSVLFDHPDPSIFTVLTAPSHREPGTAVCDFAIFPPRWLVMEDTYRPPYFHRNAMSEFAGVVINSQDEESVWNQGGEGFRPFGATLNGAMVPHGMDKRTHEEARRSELRPEKVAMEGFMIFLLESERMMGVSGWALEAAGKAGIKGSITGALKEKSKL
ncbi:homogentisate 1,2-dioxygenase [Hyaloscypha variabilis F]|uniref:homogentisate 1,2-dioxygenase n=1 Tax=Hyaloscypha variabilis (strain UAMH 11265 / GT02V1 / F) TaxID=1149755 RepID=A0A2J6RSY9_HYAVF|nr:homogentisate 1,2-dioxygenase [Hyaloscypha variabilis F]